MFTYSFFDLFQKAFGWDGSQTGGSPSGPQGGGMGGQGAQGIVHWMSVMAEHMDPAMSHYMSWNQEVSLDNTIVKISHIIYSIFTIFKYRIELMTFDQ